MNAPLVGFIAIAITLLTTSRLVAAEAGPEKPTISVESDSLRLTVGTNAHTLEFTD